VGESEKGEMKHKTADVVPVVRFDRPVSPDARLEPNCLYWLKHDEAAEVLAILSEIIRAAIKNPKIGSDHACIGPLQKLIRKFARQWFKYDRLSETHPPAFVVALIRRAARAQRKKSGERKVRK
jgi:hypothetical protein